MKNVKVIGIIMVITIIMAMSNVAFCDCDFDEGFGELYCKMMARYMEIVCREEEDGQFITISDVKEANGHFELEVSIDERYLIISPDEDICKVVINADDFGNVYFISYGWDGWIVDVDYSSFDDFDFGF